jgi:N-(2-amino-2-carboxyethyl)-L-glutamate synthase
MTGQVLGRLLADAGTRSPMRTLRVEVGGTTRRLGLKLEKHNPTGSIKYRTALGLLAAMDRERPLTPGSRVVESTSGNLGLALAELLVGLGCEFIAVVDPKVPPAVRWRMTEAGARLVSVREEDPAGGYLLARLAKVAELCAEDPDLRWPDQYRNPANPGVHRDTTAVELVEQTGGQIDAVFVAVSTGGTLAGISEGVRASVPGVRVFAVDALGSLVTGDAAHPHLLTGIGSGRRSEFLRPGHYDRALRVSDVAAFAHCRMVAQDSGLAIGGSGGAVLAAYVGDLAGDAGRSARPVAVIADGGENYRTTCHDDGWLAERGVLHQVRAEIATARARGLSYELEVADGA